MLITGRKTKEFIVFPVGMMITWLFAQQQLAKMFTMAVEIRMLVNQGPRQWRGLFFWSGFPRVPRIAGFSM